MRPRGERVNLWLEGAIIFLAPAFFGLCIAALLTYLVTRI